MPLRKKNISLGQQKFASSKRALGLLTEDAEERTSMLQRYRPCRF
jgi:hypothetical protein